MKHGGNIFEYAKKLGIDPNEIVDFSSNINAYDSKIVCDVDTHRYFDPNYTELTESVAKRYGIRPDNVALFNGASSAIFALLGQLPNRSVTLYAPLFGEYEKAAYGKRIYRIDRFRNLYASPPRGSVVVFVNPATPDGRYYDLERLFRLWEANDNTVVLDESFIEFESLPSYKKRIFDDPRLYIVQSFSKFYACGGVRVGAILSRSENIERLRIPMWALSTFDVCFLTKRFADETFVENARAHHQKQKKRLETILRRFFDVYPSDANFFLVRTQREQLFQELLRRKILVRPCGSFDYLDDRFVRFAVKEERSHQKLEKALTSVMV